MKFFYSRSKKFKAKVKSDIDNAEIVSCTIDGWSSKNSSHSLLSVTGHFIKEGKPFFAVLAAKPIKGSALLS